MLRFRSALALIGALSLGGSAAASSQVAGFSCRFVMIPMRDGVRLNTSVCEAKANHPPVPILITRTPYGISGDTMVRTDYRFLAADGYAFVFQDIRGRYKSEGQFYMNRPLHAASDAKGTDESTDTYDTVAWLLKNVPGHNGRVGVLGVSYPGVLATMAGINPHPAVKAISPQAPMTDTWIGDDFFHQGAFRLSYGFEYAGSMELSKERGDQRGLANSYCSIGLVHKARGDLVQAELMLRRSLAIDEKLGRLHGMANQYCNLGLISRRLGDLTKAGIDAIGVDVNRPTLDDVFLTLTGRSLRD